MMSIFILPICMWWIYYLTRLYNHMHDPEFLEMPWVYLWLSAYNMGWCYTLSHFFILQDIDQIIVSFIYFPLVSLIFASLYFVQEISFLWLIKSRLTVPLKLTFAVLTALYLSVVIIHFSEISYQTLYRINIILIFISTIGAGACLLHTFLKQVDIPILYIGIAHLIWYGIFTCLSALATAIFAFNALLGLMGYVAEIETPLQVTAYMVNVVAIFSMMILTGPDTLIYRSIYPFRRWQYYKLLKAKQYILANLEIKTLGLPQELELSQNLDLQVDQTLITILDYYLYLPEDNPLIKQLTNIENTQTQSEGLIFAITSLKLPRQSSIVTESVKSKVIN